jgi:hypothetical protein
MSLKRKHTDTVTEPDLISSDSDGDDDLYVPPTGFELQALEEDDAKLCEQMFDEVDEESDSDAEGYVEEEEEEEEEEPEHEEDEPKAAQ